jgi:mRNA interferase RelE/StbE
VLKLNPYPQANKFLRKLPPKQAKQIAQKITSLLSEPYPQDSKSLIGIKNVCRVDCGEYGITYRADEAKNELLLFLVGKRNDDEVYKRFGRMDVQ